MKKMMIIVLIVFVVTPVVTIGAVLYFLHHQVRGQFFDSNGVQIHYTETGAGEPVVLVHGYCVNSDINWRYAGIIRKLARHYRVIAMDARGHGLSGKPHDAKQYGLEMSDDVARLLDHLKIEKAHLVGYSMGGFITMNFLARHPDRLITAVPCGAGWIRPGSDESHILETVSKSLRERGTITPLMQKLNPGGKPVGRFRDYFENRLMRSFNDIVALAACADTFYQLAPAEEALRANKAPAMLIVGERDPMRKGVDALDGVLDNHETTIVKGGDHGSTVAKKEFADAILKFIQAHPEKS